MKPLITFSLLLLTLASFAQQKQHVYFLKNDGRYADTKDSADYTRVIQEPDSGSVLYKVMEYYPNGKLKLAGMSSNINPPAYEGTLTTYFKTGGKKTINHYTKNVLSGEQSGFYPNGKIYYTTKYPDSVASGQVYNADYQIISEYDSLGKPIITNGNGYFKGYDDKFEKVIEEGAVKNGRSDGLWKGHDDDFKVDFIETYSDGKLVSGISIGKNGDSVHYNKMRLTEPEFKGGLNAFYGYLSKHIKYPKHEVESNIQGKVVLLFNVEEDGSISNVKVILSVSENIDNEAVRVVKSSPNWIPGTAYGRKSKVYYSLPIGFKLSNN